MFKKCLKIFSLCFFILLIVLICSGIYPFGSKTLIVSDLRDQYLTFINYLKSVFFGNNSIFYTFSGSLGENFLTLSAYYLMSISNLITLLFETSQMPIVLTFIILFKISLSSVSMYYYLENYNINKKTNYLFALCYGLMSYTLCFYFHIMWLDTIVLFPLLVLGIENIVNKRKCSLYLIILTLIILSNYYMGVITCLFSVIYFLYYLIINNKKGYLKSILIKYSLSSILAGLICSFILIPVFYSLFNGKAIASDVNTIHAYYFNSLQIISKLFLSSFDYSSIWHGGPNLFVGSFIVYLVIISFFNKNISHKNRIMNLLIIIFLFLTFRIHQLDLLFHGLTEPNCFDFRHAFIMSFMLIKIGYDSFNNLSVNQKKNIFVLTAIFLIHLIIFFSNLSYYSGYRIVFLILSMGFYFGIAYLIQKRKYALVYSLVLIELIINCFNSFNVITNFEKNASNLDEYYNYVNHNSEIINRIKDDSFYRLEKDYHYSNSINDSMLLNYRGISHFDSTSNINTEKFLENIGFRRLMSRAFYDKGSTKFIDMLLGIKYVLSYENSIKDYLKLFGDKDINVYQNPYYLSMGFLVNDIYDIKFTDNVFENMNLISANIVGNNNLYKKINYDINYYNVERKGDIYYGQNESSFITYTFKSSTLNDYYLYFKDNLERDKFKTATIYVNNYEIKDYFNKYNYGMIYLGKFDIDSVVTIKIMIDNTNNQLEFSDGLIYFEDSDIFSSIYNYLKKESVSVSLEKNNNLSFNLYSNEHKKMVLSIPYEDGWIIMNNNSKIDYQKAFNGLISIDINKGNNIITMKYIPPGFKLGLVISIISILISIAWIGCEKNEKKV